jgi:hypothetical protein
MADNMLRSDATAGWLEDLAESEAELAAGLTVSGESVRARVRAALAWFEDRQNDDASQQDNAAR